MVIVLCVGVFCIPVQRRAEVILSRRGTAGETTETVLSVFPGLPFTLVLLALNSSFTYYHLLTDTLS